MRGNWNRRRVLQAGLGLSALGAAAGYWALSALRNPCAHRSEPGHGISTQLRERFWSGIDPAAFIDMHVHVVGNLSEGPQAQSWMNPEMTRVYNPFLLAHFAVFADASCMTERPLEAGEAYVARLLELVEEFPPGARFMLLALDGWHDTQGNWIPANTVLKVGNDFVSGLARRFPGRFTWAASIHPYRKDALAALERAALAGASAVKWIPYLMGIDPASHQCDAFYARLAQLGLPLVVHSGWEHSLIPDADQEWGNPLRLRRALEAGVKVVAAHCATQGEMRDDESAGSPTVPAFSLLRRLMEEPEHRGLLFGDISGVVSNGREPDMVRELVLDERWQGRLVNGSDYPLPGSSILTSTRRLVELGFLTSDDDREIGHIQGHNPLLYDFGIKRLLRIDGRSFPAQVFEPAALFRPSAVATTRSRT
ncbi:MAG: amidohydrolase family protein [Usitatibacter sp.]